MIPLFNVFIFCGGKCGGVTLSRTMEKSGYRVCHLHNFNSKGLYTSNIDMTKIYDIIDKSCKTFEKVYFIDAYRTPIERKISSFFQNISAHVPHYKSLPMTDLISIFNTRFLAKLDNYHPMNMLLDYYKLPAITTFDFSKQYNVIEHGNKVIVKLLFKDINNWGARLSGICNKPIQVMSENLTKNKPIGKFYSDFLRLYTVPASYLKIILSEPEFKIYNSEQDQTDYRIKWTLKSTD